MRCGGGGPKPVPVPAHPRYVPKRGAVLKRAVRAVLRFFLSPMSHGPATASAAAGHAASDSDGAAEQGN
ncbi:hypothetical protein BRADI_3g59868v3 [Brachypodium distachyon]|uniref:Uncharacterized protein n=1 Tax=Brachypodium distachyon TaxID=15368 RepID=A0A2K2D5Y0_BRADI|nr:hypothetical protein BRADI_3g59868v3 [Brachypodium distachyon]